MKIVKPYCNNGHLRTPETVYKDGKCKQCGIAYALQWEAAHKETAVKTKKKWREANSEKIRISSRRNNLKKQGWTPAMVDEAKVKQNNLCAICNEHMEVPNADHKHVEPPQPRELLCKLCNFALGGFRDNPSICEAAANYLRKHGEI